MDILKVSRSQGGSGSIGRLPLRGHFTPPTLSIQVKELSSRAEFLRSEREKALKLLQAEQQQSASLRQSVEALQSQV